MGDKLNGEEYFEAGAAAFNYNNVTGGTDSASGGSGGSGMECLQLRTPPEPFHYLISEQAKSLVALQELQNEVGALLEFRDLVIETFPNLRSKMPPSTPASSTRRDWEPGVRVRRKLAAGTDSARTKPQPSVQDSGFSTETSCGKDAHSSASASASASRSRPVEDELLALLDVIQRKGARLRDEADQLRGEMDANTTAEESFARAMQACECGDLQRLRSERDALLARAAELEAAACLSPRTPPPRALPLGRLDAALGTPRPRIPTPCSSQFAAILSESSPVELQRQLLTSTVHNQVLCERLKKAAEQRTLLLERLEAERDMNEDLKFRLEEKSIELEGAKALVRKLEKNRSTDSIERSRDLHSSMRDMQPVYIPDDEEANSSKATVDEAREEAKISETPRRRPSRIPQPHAGNKGPAPGPPSRPPSAHSVRSSRSTSSRHHGKSSVPVRHSPNDNKRVVVGPERRESLQVNLAEYLARTERLAPLFPRLHTVRSRPLPADLRLAYESPQNLALELTKSILYEDADSIDITNLKSHDSLWNGKPQQYFESINCGRPDSDKEYDSDSLAP